METEILEHRKLLDIGIAEGWVLFAGPKDPRDGGWVVLRGESEESLRRFFAGDPYILKNLAVFEFNEFHPLKMQPFLTQWVE
jgi:uncharacterized protein YciI